jgi:hypothetical protein
MASETIILTALPNGISGAKRELSVFVSPRLVPASPLGGTLAEFPNWLNWPAQIRSVTRWTVTTDFSGPTTFTATVKSPAPRTDLWRALFPASTPVNPYAQPSYDGNVVRSYPVSSIHDFLEQLYATVAAGFDQFNGNSPRDPTTFPDFTHLVNGNDSNGILRDFHLVREDSEGYFDEEIQYLEENDQVLRQVRFNSATNIGSDILLLKRFHDRQPPDENPISPPVFDFHSLVSLLGDHPELLRLLGLVVDLEIGDPGSPLSPFCNAIPTWTPAVVPNTLTTTPTFYNPPTFRPGFVNSEYGTDGWLRFDDTTQFDTLEVEIDSGGLKLYDWMRSMWYRLAYLSTSSAIFDRAIQSDTPFQPLPSLRSGGLSAFRIGRAEATIDYFNVLDSMHTQGYWTGDNVVRGYRIDVWDDTTNQWHQLCARSTGATGGYHFLRNGLTVVPAPAEGWVSDGITQDAPTDSDTYQGETFFHWTGWSLVAPRPGRPFSDDPGQAPVDPPGNPSATSLQLEVSYAATPGTLPKLRFGRSYRFRSRAVDLAGNSVPPATAFSAAFQYMSPPQFYGRFEPVESPALVMRKARTEGESTEHMVIRSNFNIADGTVPTNERHCVVPMTSVDMVEQHGMLDAATGLDHTKYSMLVARDGQTLDKGGTPDPGNYGSVFWDVNVLNVPYIPDPIAAGATVQNIPGSAPIKVPFFDAGAAWPVSRAFRLVLKAGTGAPILPTAANNYALTIFLAKAQTIEILVSSNLTGPGLNVMGLWQWLTDLGYDSSALRALVIAGKHWMFTPYRVVTLTHAVRQPLVAPDFTILTSTRTLYGQTDATIAGQVTIDRPSTGKLEVLADWDEPIDPLGEPGPRVVRGQATAFSLDEPTTGLATKDIFSHSHEFHDTKHRLVNYAAIATSRFVEYFAQTVDVTLTGFTPTLVDALGIVPGTDSVQSIVTPPVLPTAYVRGVDYDVDETGGKIVRKAGGAIPSGATVFVRYVPPSVTRSSLEVITPPEVARGRPVDVLSTARPAAPDVRYLVPTFDWRGASVPPANLQSTRTGNGLRVYLGRPWFSSGDGECLGVVLIPGNQPVTAGVPEIVQKFGTLWGRDPIWMAGGNVSNACHAGSFALAINNNTGLTLDEVAGATYEVAGHAVQYDPVRQLWFSDLVVDLGTTYNPFIRLALARYQPDSIPGAHLSHVVLADVFPLSPTRTLVATFDPIDATALSLSLSGITYKVPDSAHPASVITVQVQARQSGVAGPLGWQPVGTAVTMTSLGAALGITTWTASVTLPDERGSQPFQLVIRETEMHDDGTGTFVPRTVYTDTLEL